MTEVNPPAWEQAGSYAAYQDRMTLSALLAPDPAPGPFAGHGGVRPSSSDTGMAVTQDVTADMFVLVGSGSCYVPAAIQSNAGWLCVNNGTVSRQIQGASASNPRIDLVIAHVYDAVDDSGTQSKWAIEVVTGTPAGAPAVPAVPTNAIVLAQVAVAANATSITAGNITDVRPWMVAVGGILPVNGLTAVPAGYSGMYVHDRVTGRLAHNTVAGAAQPHLLPAAPVMNSANTMQSEGSNAEVTSLTLSFTADGATDWEIYYKCPGTEATQTGSPSYWVLWRMYIDNVQVDAMWGAKEAADGNAYGGVAWSYFASAAMSTRPSAATHTVKVTWQSQASFGVSLYAAALNPIMLRVRPVCL